MKPFNRFDMEQQIMTCWNICEDLDTVMEGVLEGDMNQDRISNVLLGMKELYHLKFEKLWLQFEAMCRETYEANQAKKYHDAYTNYDRDLDNMNSTTARGEYIDEGN
jgi:hypothetical protein